MHDCLPYNVSVAVIGCGNWGKNLIRNFAALDCLAAICDHHEERMRHWQLQTGAAMRSWSEILADPKIQAVIIATPAHTHSQLAEEALNANKHVWVEKPLSLSLLDAENLIELSRRRHRQILVGHILLYHPAFKAAFDFIQAGTIGAIHKIQAYRLTQGPLRSEGVLWDFAPHDLSMCTALLMGRAHSLSLHKYRYQEDVLIELEASLKINNSVLDLHFSWDAPEKVQNFIVTAEHGSLIFNDQEAIDKKCRYKMHHEDEWQSIEYTYSEPLKAECQHFLACISKQSTPVSSAQSAIPGLQIIMALENLLKSHSLTPQKERVSS